MDALKAVQTYITKMLDEVSGMKVLLMDAHTVGPRSHACKRLYLYTS